MNTLLRQFNGRKRAEHGATAVEYALMLTVMFTLIFGAVLIFGGRLNGSFQSTANTIPG